MITSNNSCGVIFGTLGILSQSYLRGVMLVATDGDLKVNGDPDTFRIKIWDKATDEIIYDNQMGMFDDDMDSGDVLGGGSIVIHTPKKK